MKKLNHVQDWAPLSFSVTHFLFSKCGRAYFIDDNYAKLYEVGILENRFCAGYVINEELGSSDEGNIEVPSLIMAVKLAKYDYVGVPIKESFFDLSGNVIFAKTMYFEEGQIIKDLWAPKKLIV